MFSNQFKRLVVLGTLVAYLPQVSMAKAAGPNEASKPAAESVSLYQLLRTPEKYNGIRVKVSGYLLQSSKLQNAQAYLCAKYLTVAGLAANKGWIIVDIKDAHLDGIPISPTRKAHIVDKRSVLVEGVFEWDLHRRNSGFLRVSNIDSKLESSKTSPNWGIGPDGYKILRRSPAGPTGDFYLLKDRTRGLNVQ